MPRTSVIKWCNRNKCKNDSARDKSHRINGGYRLFHTSAIFSDVFRRATWTDCGAASWNGTRDVQETNRGTNERDAGLLVVSTNEREKWFLHRCTVIMAIWRAYETLASGNPKIRGIRRHFHERWGRFHSECILKWEPTRSSSRARRILHAYTRLRANLCRLILNANNIICVYNWTLCRSAISMWHLYLKYNIL
jgi:hypothetical protein